MPTLKTVYATPVDLTITLASLASSSTRVAGRESTAVDNTTNKYLDALVAGKITAGATVTANTYIDVWVYAQADDTPTYPTIGGAAGSSVVLSGSDAAATCATEGIRNNAMRLGASILVDATTANREYSFTPFSVAALFGGTLPKRWGVWVSHNLTGAALNSTGGNHKITYSGIHRESV